MWIAFSGQEITSAASFFFHELRHGYVDEHLGPIASCKTKKSLTTRGEIAKQRERRTVGGK